MQPSSAASGAAGKRAERRRCAVILQSTMYGNRLGTISRAQIDNALCDAEIVVPGKHRIIPASRKQISAATSRTSLAAYAHTRRKIAPTCRGKNEYFQEKSRKKRRHPLRTASVSCYNKRCSKNNREVFHLCQAIPSGQISSTKRARRTPSAAKSLRRSAVKSPSRCATAAATRPLTASSAT